MRWRQEPSLVQSPQYVPKGVNVRHDCQISLAWVAIRMISATDGVNNRAGHGTAVKFGDIVSLFWRVKNKLLQLSFR